MYHDMESDMLRAAQLLQELTDQNARNRDMSAKLVAMAGQLKTEAGDISSGFSLRRFNVDLSKETFESELERTNAQTIIENHSLNHENRQLSLLLKESEQTLETIMSKFRSHAVAAQQHELTLTRHYENLILSRETSSLNTDLTSSTAVAQSLDRLSQNLRALFRSMAGEDPQSPPLDPSSPDPDSNPSDPTSAPPDTPLSDTDLLDNLLSTKEDWSLERESEITRLEQENEELRKILGIDKTSAEENGWIEDEERELAYTKSYTPIPTLHARRRSMSSSVSASSPSGMSMGIGFGGGGGGGMGGGGMGMGMGMGGGGGGFGGGMGGFGGGMGFGGMVGGGLGNLGSGIGRSSSPGANTITVPSNSTSSLILRPPQQSQTSPFTLTSSAPSSYSSTGMGGNNNNNNGGGGGFLSGLIPLNMNTAPNSLASQLPSPPPNPQPNNPNNSLINLTPSAGDIRLSTTAAVNSALGIVPPQRSESLPGMRAGPQGNTNRRTAMFGSSPGALGGGGGGGTGTQRGRGGLAGPQLMRALTPPFNDGDSDDGGDGGGSDGEGGDGGGDGPVLQDGGVTERPWQAQAGLDLS